MVALHLAQLSLDCLQEWKSNNFSEQSDLIGPALRRQGWVMKPILTQITLTLEGPVKGWKDEQFHMRNDWMGCVSSAQQRSIMVVCKVIDWNGEGEWDWCSCLPPVEKSVAIRLEGKKRRWLFTQWEIDLWMTLAKGSHLWGCEGRLDEYLEEKCFRQTAVSSVEEK